MQEYSSSVITAFVAKKFEKVKLCDNKLQTSFKFYSKGCKTQNWQLIIIIWATVLPLMFSWLIKASLLLT